MKTSHKPKILFYVAKLSIITLNSSLSHLSTSIIITHTHLKIRQIPIIQTLLHSHQLKPSPLQSLNNPLNQTHTLLISIMLKTNKSPTIRPTNKVIERNLWITWTWCIWFRTSMFPVIRVNVPEDYLVPVLTKVSLDCGVCLTIWGTEVSWFYTNVVVDCVLVSIDVINGVLV